MMGQAHMAERKDDDEMEDADKVDEAEPVSEDEVRAAPLAGAASAASRARPPQSEKVEDGCQFCGSNARTDTIVICDEPTCQKEYHLFCLRPPLPAVPDGKWFCPSCTRRTCAYRALAKKANSCAETDRPTAAPQCAWPFRSRRSTRRSTASRAAGSWTRTRTPARCRIRTRTSSSTCLRCAPACLRAPACPTLRTRQAFLDNVEGDVDVTPGCRVCMLNDTSVPFVKCGSCDSSALRAGVRCRDCS
jgi:hypothetical protein